MSKKSGYLESILDENEKQAVRLFYNSEVMREAVRKCLLSDAYYNGTLKPGQAPDPTYNFALSFVANLGDQNTDEQIGRVLRASFEGIRLVENAFSAMSQFEDEKEPKRSEENPGR